MLKLTLFYHMSAPHIHIRAIETRTNLVCSWRGKNKDHDPRLIIVMNIEI